MGQALLAIWGPLAGAFILGAVSGWNLGWDRGKKAGDREHAECHAAVKEIAATIVEHADIQAWEEEL